MIAALFVRRDSHYKAMADVDCYDEDRDALMWAGGCPGVFHPPCRTWGKLAGFVKDAPTYERDLAHWSMAMVRRYGGVVEHPLHSKLWAESGCLTPGLRDRFGGVLVTVNQGDFGHEAPKATGLYIVGADAPELPFNLAEPAGRVERLCRQKRERTSPQFCALLVHVARSAVREAACV